MNMPEIHAGIRSLLEVTLLVFGVVGLFLQAVRFLIIAITQVADE
jgi:multidrug efflux pump subunit AcrB